MNVVILHAYSASNSGDGLLVDEAIAITRSAYPDARITVLALDPESFVLEGVPVIHPFTAEPSTPGAYRMLQLALGAWLRGARLPEITRSLVETADLVVGVGGGYLRAGNPIEAIKMLLAHAPQIPSSTGTRSIYLPQSVGPLRFGSAPLMRRRLANISSITLRDNRSCVELASLSTTVRLPDTALLGIPRDLDTAGRVTPGSTHLGLVARALPGSKRRKSRYADALRHLHGRSDARPLVQAMARGNDDSSFYAAMGWLGNHETLRAATAVGAPARPGVIASVRLHGAIQSIRNGVPAIHLSYERKGWGAFEDLGLPGFVHNAYDFDSDLVLEQAHALRDDPSSYWAAVDRAIPRLASAHRSLVDQLKSTEKAALL